MPTPNNWGRVDHLFRTCAGLCGARTPVVRAFDRNVVVHTGISSPRTDSPRDVENIVNAIIDEIVKALGRGDRVELRDFGVFSTKIRGARKGRNPKTGAEVQVAQKVIPLFKTGKEMRARLNRETARSVD